MEELNFITPKIVEDSVFKDYDTRRAKIENMMHDYKASLMALGYNPDGKDLIEVITFLANTLTAVICTVQYQEKKIKDNYTESLAGRIND